MSTTLEADTDTAAVEAAAALEAQENDEALQARAEELQAAAAAGQFEDSAGITDEKEAGEAAPLTQAEREASAEHDPAPKTPARKRAPKSKAAQGNLAGGWEELIGGEPDEELKLSLHMPAGTTLENAPEKLLKQTVHRIVVTVKVTGFSSDDTLDPETHDVASSKGKRKLRVLSGSFLEPDEYITSDTPATD